MVRPLSFPHCWLKRILLYCTVTHRSACILFATTLGSDILQVDASSSTDMALVAPSDVTCWSDCRSYNDGKYDFNYQMDGAQALWNQHSYMNEKS